MADDADIPVLRRKAGASRASRGLAEMTPAKAMRLALAQAGDRALGVPVALTDLQQATLSPDILAQHVPDPALILRLDGPDGAVALAVLCPQAVGAAIEAQTLGKVLRAPSPDRRPTATDALLVQGFVDLVVSGFASASDALRGLPPLDGYSYTARIADTRLAAMTIEDSPHLHLTAALDFAGGAKTGSLHLIFPARRRGSGQGAAQAAPWSEALERAVLNSPARLEAQLGKLSLPLADVAALQVGQVVPLGRAASLDKVVIRAADGRRILTARLGRSGTMRAVRLRLKDEGGAPSSGRELASLSSPDGAALGVKPAAAPAPAAATEPGGDLPSAQPLPGLDVPQ